MEWHAKKEKTNKRTQQKQGNNANRTERQKQQKQHQNWTRHRNKKRGGGGDLATRGPGTIVLGHKCIGCISAQTITAKAGEGDKGNPHGVEGQSPNTEPSL